MILVPVKSLANAKQRLAPLLDQNTRTELARAMLADVLEAVANYGKQEVAVVTSDEFATLLARRHGFGTIRDESNRSETDAIEMATEVCESRGIVTTLVIPGDIPLIEAGDLAVIFDHAPQRGSVLVPAADGRGTNAALRTPASLFPLRFGSDSFVPHVRSAKATGSPCIILELRRIALDIDSPDDLRQLARESGSKRSQIFARSLLFDIAEPAQAAS